MCVPVSGDMMCVCPLVVLIYVCVNIGGVKMCVCVPVCGDNMCVCAHQWF